MPAPAIRPLPQADVRDVSTIERAAKEIIRQAGFLRRNGDGDQVRFLTIRLEERRLSKALDRGGRRYEAKYQAAQP